MKKIYKLLVLSIVSMLAFSHSVQASDGDRKEYLIKLLDEDNQKRLLCEISALNGHIVHDLFKHGEPKNVAEMVMQIDDYPTDSLEYELASMAIDQAYKNVSSEEISKAMMTYCISRPFYEVNNLSTGRQELIDMAAKDKAWEEAQCDNRQINLWDAYDATTEDQIRKLLKAAKNVIWENKMYKVLQAEDSDERQESYDELMNEFESYCGAGEINK